VQTVATTDGNHLQRLAGFAPHALAGELFHVVAGFGLAMLLHWVLPRGAVWIGIAIALAVLYPVAMHVRLAGHASAHVWTGIPFGMLLSLAAIDGIPRALREAAAVDRATGWFWFRTLTLPLAAPLALAGVIFLAAVALTPLTMPMFIAAHVLLVSAIAMDAAMRSAR
jgi:ABC-type glycerol-3-phosphate transport system permease component